MTDFYIELFNGPNTFFLIVLRPAENIPIPSIERFPAHPPIGTKPIEAPSIGKLPMDINPSGTLLNAFFWFASVMRMLLNFFDQDFLNFLLTKNLSDEDANYHSDIYLSVNDLKNF